jgi:aldose 1-epimerase
MAAIGLHRGMAAISPSGEQVELALGDQRAVVVEVGGGLRAYSAGGRDVLDGYSDDEMCPSGRGQVLSPWPNRVEDGSYEFGGRRHQLALDQPDERNAIHGLVRWSRWRVAQREPHRVVMEHVLHPQPGYPFALALAIEYGLTERGLEVRTTATNVGAQRCPYGTGAHPYFAAGPGLVDDAVLRAPAHTVLRSDERGIPAGESPVEGTEYDFRDPRPIGDTRLDHCFTGLDRDGDDRARVELRDADGRGVTVWMDEAHGYVMLFTGDPLPDVARRSLAIEPMTCPPSALRTGRDLICLDPGDTHTCAWGVDIAR